MPPPPSFISALNTRITGSTLSEVHKTRLKALLHGVKLGAGPYYIYSCPFPFYDRPELSSLTDTFANKLIEAAGRLLTQTGLHMPLSDEDLFRQLFILNDDIAKVVIYPGYASGDMYGFGAALTINDKLQMLIMRDSANPGRLDQSASTNRFLTEVVDGTRVRMASAPTVFAKNPNPEKKPKGKELEYLKALDAQLWTMFLEKGEIHCAVDLFFGTSYVAHCFSRSRERGEPRKSSRLAVRNKWLQLASLWNTPSSAIKTGIGNFLKSRIHEVSLGDAASLALPQKANIVVLWSRFTGKKGGAHVEYDTSITGLKQLVRCAFASGAEYVFIAGDRPKTSAVASEEKKLQRQRLLQELRQEILTEPQYAHGSKPMQSTGPKRRMLVDLTEFWERPEWRECLGLSVTQKAKRIDQFKLFEVLAQNNKVKHFGARSGNLESLALLGYTVCYFEDGDVDRRWENAWVIHGFFDSREDGSPHRVSMEDEPGPVPGAEAPMDKKRMEPWHQTVGYKRIKIAQVPTRSGKFLIANGLGGQPSWTYDKRMAGSESSAEDVEAAYGEYYFSGSAPAELLPPSFASSQQKAETVRPFLKPDGVKDMNKGFDTKDLVEIANYLAFR